MDCKILIFVLLINLRYISGQNDEYIDLTFAFNKDIVLWPGRFSTFNVEMEGFTPNGIWIASKGFCISEHTSTHIDAPYHFNKEGLKLDQIPLHTLIDIQGVVIDIYDKVHKFENGVLKVIENYVLKREDIIEWEKVNGQIPPNSVVLLRTGWGSRWPNRVEYLGLKENETETEEEGKKPTVDLNPNVNYPGFSAASAQFLVIERHIYGAGIDCISIDAGSEKNFLAHQFFMSRNRYLLENVANLHLLPARGFKLFIVPFKVDQGTGSPTRVLAKLTKEKEERKLPNQNETDIKSKSSGQNEISRIYLISLFSICLLNLA